MIRLFDAAAPNANTSPMIEWVRHTSRAIKGFPMGDPHERDFPIYLPPGYATHDSKRYPVVFFLAGFTGKGATYITDDSAFGTPLPKRFDSAVADGSLAPFIGVFPDCTSKLGHSQYVNSPAIGNYMDYVCDELVAFVDERYRTIRDPAFRIVAGHSSGGFGALIIGMQRPDAFHWIGSSAGDGFYEMSFRPTAIKAVIEVSKAGGVAKFVEEVLAKPMARNIPGGQVDAILTLAMAPCYAPNVNHPPLYGDLFFDLETAEVIPEVWERYAAWDPVKMVDRSHANLKRLKFIQLEAGLQDEHGLQFCHRQLAKKFSALGVPHELAEYPGGHSGHHWRFEGRLKRLLARMMNH